MHRFGPTILVAALVVGACSSGGATASQSPAGPNGTSSGLNGPTPSPSPTLAIDLPPLAAGDVRFTIMFTFDDRADEPDFWHAGEFTTTGTLSATVINALTATRHEIGPAWPSSGKQQFGDFSCESEDQCLDPCVGSFDSRWQAEPEVARIAGSGAHLVLDVQLHSEPPAGDEQFLTSADCPPSTNGGTDGFPPMHITIDGYGTATPTYATEPYAPEGIPPPPPGTIWKLAISPA